MNILLRVLLNKCSKSMIIVTDYYTIVSKDTPSSSINKFADFIRENDPNYLHKAVSYKISDSADIISNNCAKFYSKSIDSLSDLKGGAVYSANEYSRAKFGKDRVFFAAVDFPSDRSYGTGASESLLWELLDTGNGGKTNDHKYYYRASLCDRVSCYWDDKIQAIGHPNVDGDQQYYLAIQEILEQKLSDFGTIPTSNEQASSAEQEQTQVVDSSPPNIQAFQVMPQSLAVGESFTIDYTVSDEGGSGLKQVELWRKDEMSDWQQIKPPNMLAGETGPTSGSFTDSPSATGKYWYGVHVVDNAGNWNDQKNSNTNGQPRSFEPVGANVNEAGYSEAPATTTLISQPRLLYMLEHKNVISSASFSPDSRRVATAGWDGTAVIWDAATGSELQKLNHVKDVYVKQIAFSPDGNKVATLSEPLGGSGIAIRIWDVATGSELQKLNLDFNSANRPIRIAFGHDGCKVAILTSDAVRMWDVQSGSELQMLNQEDGINMLALSPDGSRVATAASWNDTATIWDVATGSELQKLNNSDYMYQIAFSLDGSKIATTSADNGVYTVRIWDAVTGAKSGELSMEYRTMHAPRTTFGPGGSRITTASDEGTIRIWDVTTGTEIQKLNGSVAFVVFSPDLSKMATVGHGMTVGIWDMRADR